VQRILYFLARDFPERINVCKIDELITHQQSTQCKQSTQITLLPIVQLYTELMSHLGGILSDTFIDGISLLTILTWRSD